MSLNGASLGPLDALLCEGSPYVHRKLNFESRVFQQIDALDDLRRRLLHELDQPSDLRPMIRDTFRKEILGTVSMFRQRMVSTLTEHSPPPEKKRKRWFGGLHRGR